MARQKQTELIQGSASHRHNHPEREKHMTDSIDSLILEHLKRFQSGQDRIERELREVKNRLSQLEIGVAISRAPSKLPKPCHSHLRHNLTKMCSCFLQKRLTIRSRRPPTATHELRR